MVSTTTTSVTYTGNGATVDFSFPYPYNSKSHLVVSVDAATKTIGTDYTVDNAGPSDSGTVTFVTAPDVDAVVVISRTTAKTQLADYTNNDAFPAETHEQALDKLTLIVQELAAIVAAQSTASGGIYTGPDSNPNNVVTATAPAVYYGADGSVWIKTDTLATNTGWFQKMA